MTRIIVRIRLLAIFGLAAVAVGISKLAAVLDAVAQDKKPPKT